MPRLTKEQAIDHYGRNLPTPTIDRIVLSDVPDSLRVEAFLRRALATGETAEIIESSLDDVVQVNVDISFLFSTDENFNSDDILKALFDIQNDVTGADRSLYLTLYTSYNRITDNESVLKTDIIRNFVPSPSLRDMIMSEAYEPGTIDFGRFEEDTFFTGLSETIPLVSVPLSDYNTVAELTSEMDADGNSVIRVANIKITTYLRNFEDKDNMNLFCAVSTKHPYEIKTPTSFSLDPITISMNYSDVSYETVIKDGQLAIIDEPVYVDSNGIQYPRKPLAAINGKYYKTDNFGNKQIADSVLAFIGEYKTDAQSDEILQAVSDEMEAVLVSHRKRIDLLQSLNQTAQGISVTNPVSSAIRFVDRARILINNADAVLRSQEEVVKRIYRNYKIVDARTTIASLETTPSYVDELEDRDFLYQDIFNTNIANYVPMATAGDDYPGKAELPVTPSEMVAQYSEDLASITRQLQDALIPLSAGEATSGTVLEKIDRAIEVMTDWCFNEWAGKFIKGSTHEAYQNADGHSGAHYYITNNSLDNNPTTLVPALEWNWGYDRDNYTLASWEESSRGGTDDEGSKKYVTEFRWQRREAGRAPWWKEVIRWESLVKGASKDRSPPKFPWAKDRPASGDQSISKDNPYNDSIEGRHPEWIRNKFGYIPSPDSNRPDNSPRDNGPTYQINWSFEENFDTSVRSQTDEWRGESPARWWWFDRFFWSLTSEDAITGLYCLAQQEHQIEFFVPNPAGVLTLYGDFAWEDDDGSIPASTYDVVDADGRIITNSDMYMEAKYQKVGGIQAIFPNTLDPEDDNGNQKGLAFPTTYHPPRPRDGGIVTQSPDAPRVIWWRCVRRKYNDIYNQIKEIYYSIYGIDPETLEFVAGTGAVFDGPPSRDTNPETDLDEQLSAGPLRIVEQALQEILTKIDNRPADDFDTESERNVFTNIYLNELGERIANLSQQYYNKKSFVVYACTGRPRYRSVLAFPDSPGHGLTYPDNSVHTLPQGTSVIAEDNLHKKIAYGDWGPIPKEGSNVFWWNLGQGFINLMIENFNQNREQIAQLISNYISAKALFTGFKSDTGIHSALAEVDIVLSKYGYFFFDMEKYIRKKSHISKVVNVDRFMNNFATARFMTNAACTFNEASVQMDNFGIDPVTGGESTTQAAKITLTKNVASTLERSRPHSFEKMTFQSPVDPITERPLVYRKINALQGISFEQITEFTNDRAIVDSESALAASAADITDPLSGTASRARGVQGYISVGGETSTPDVDLYDTQLGEALAETQERLAQQEALIARQEIDVEGLTSGPYRPKELYSNLVMRNYAFPGYNNLSLRAGKRWRRDYRMMMFRYQFFIDDDDAFKFSGDPDLDDGNVSYDNMTFQIKINDNSHQTYYELVKQFEDALEYFNDEYVAYAEESCAFNSYDQGFNEFFVNQMTHPEYGLFPNPPQTPWHKMIAFYIIYRNILTDEFGGSTLLMFESGDRILEQIRPETGNLLSLRNFYDACTATMQLLNSGKETLESEVTETQFTFTYNDVIGSAIIDHIGDYSDRLEDPRLAEFSGDEALEGLYDYEDF